MAKRQSVSEFVQDYIRDYIINNKLGPGDQLPPEGEIAATLEVSRVSVRESVKILQALGIVEVRHVIFLVIYAVCLSVICQLVLTGETGKEDPGLLQLKTKQVVAPAGLLHLLLQWSQSIT